MSTKDIPLTELNEYFTVEGWPYEGHAKQGKDLQSKYNRAEKALFRAEARMRRAFTAWEKARATHKRIVKLLEKGK